MKKILFFLIVIMIFSCSEDDENIQDDFKFDGLQTYTYRSELTEENFQVYAFEGKLENEEDWPEKFIESNIKDEKETHEMFHEFQIDNDSIYINVIDFETKNSIFSFNRKIKIENEAIFINIVNNEGEDLGFEKLFEIETNNILSLYDVKYIEVRRTKSSDGSFEIDISSMIGYNKTGYPNYYDEDFKHSIAMIKEEEIFALFKFKRFFYPI